ncbi:inner membrane symporter yicj-related [Anaeramoeba flamelloides]|uniref:Inner membrane symporter yicj-related n=1 Tax=Anaeramoeba flamelloides TaxID=1746091 RepID=A0AAV7ZU59_9EUKA|nr:inner membrane symporter yicj-related [Anaeramoeba flamelloides]
MTDSYSTKGSYSSHMSEPDSRNSPTQSTTSVESKEKPAIQKSQRVHKTSTTICYGFGGLTDQMTHQMFQFLVFTFYYSVVGIKISTLSWGFIIFAIWDSINDPLIGQLSDNTKSKLGRRRFWVLVSILPLALTNLLLFTIGTGWPQWGKVLYMILIIILYDTFYTIFSTNQLALFSEMYRNEEERGFANSWNSVLLIVGVVIGFVMPTLLIKNLVPIDGLSQSETDQISIDYIKTGGVIGILVIFSAYIFFKYGMKEPKGKNEYLGYEDKDKIKMDELKTEDDLGTEEPFGNISEQKTGKSSEKEELDDQEEKDMEQNKDEDVEENKGAGLEEENVDQEEEEEEENTKKKNEKKKKKKDDGIFKMLKETLKNRCFLIFCFANMIKWFVFKMLTTVVTLYSVWILDIKEGSIFISILLLSSFLTAAAAIPLMKKIGTKFGWRNAFILTQTFWSFALIPFWFLDGRRYVALFCMCTVGIGLSGAIYFVEPIVAQIIDEDEVNTKSRRAGSYYGVNGLINRYSTIIVFGVLAIVLNGFGWEQYLVNGDVTVQKISQLKTALKLLMGPICIFGNIIVILLLFKFPLHGERLKEVQKKLKLMNAETN